MRKHCAIVCLLLLLVVSLVACNKPKDPSESESLSESESEVITGSLDIVVNGASQYKVIFPEGAEEAIFNAATRLQAAISKKYGIAIEATSDLEFGSQKRTDYEILIGSTNRDESVRSGEGLRYLDSIIAVDGTRVVINGGCSDAISLAVDTFITDYIEKQDASLALPTPLKSTVKGDYALSSAKIGNTPIESFTIVAPSSLDEAADIMADTLGRATGAIISVQRSSTGIDGAMIVLNRPSKNYAYDDFEITASDTLIELDGGSEYSVEIACDRLLDMLLDDGAVAPAELTCKYSAATRAEYVNDINKLIPHWSLRFDPPEWMLDFDEKYAAFEDPDGRFMVSVHRGEMEYYPENSIEGIISSILMGADMIELDPRRTKDGVLVLLHDAKLIRTTDFSEKAGKNGLPTSEYVWDWTYEQLQQLNLREGIGGTSANITPYKIPTLEEAIKVCANRIFIRLDRKLLEDDVTCAWGFEKDIWPLLIKHDAYTTVIMTWHSEFTKGTYALVRKYRALAITACGKPMHNVLAGPEDYTRAPGLISDNNLTPAVRVSVGISEAPLAELIKKNQGMLNYYKGKVRLYQDAHAPGDIKENVESHEFYDALYNAGINFILSNKSVLSCSYIAENFGPTEYSK